MNCSCETIPCGAESQLISRQCNMQLPATVTISQNSGMLNTVFEYTPGETYYLTCKIWSFMNGIQRVRQ